MGICSPSHESHQLLCLVDQFRCASALAIERLYTLSFIFNDLLPCIFITKTKPRGGSRGGCLRVGLVKDHTLHSILGPFPTTKHISNGKITIILIIRSVCFIHQRTSLVIERVQACKASIR